MPKRQSKVLNLIITGIPSIQNILELLYSYQYLYVLNLIITGIPSILTQDLRSESRRLVLNLIITGIPSILMLKNRIESEIKF